MKILVTVRRFEKLYLDTFIFGIKISDITWLSLSNTNRSVPTDSLKRKHLFHEVVLWLLNSFALPLIKSCFYVTETSVHKNQLHFFRHKIWTKLHSPLYHSLIGSIYDRLDNPEVEDLLNKETNAIGISSMRLLPKQVGARPIVNLSRKISGEKWKLSINDFLRPVFESLTMEIVFDQ